MAEAWRGLWVALRGATGSLKLTEGALLDQIPAKQSV
jgi:hypothetical protein